MTIIPFSKIQPAKEIFIERYSRAEAVEMFGIVPKQELTAAEKARAKDVNDTLDALSYHTGIYDAKLCLRTYGDNVEEAYQVLYGYLNNVTSCPQEVLDEAERLIKLRHEQELAKFKAP